jgi:hypothetical protein
MYISYAFIQVLTHYPPIPKLTPHLSMPTSFSFMFNVLFSPLPLFLLYVLEFKLLLLKKISPPFELFSDIETRILSCCHSLRRRSSLLSPSLSPSRTSILFYSFVVQVCGYWVVFINEIVLLYCLIPVIFRLLYALSHKIH